MVNINSEEAKKAAKGLFDKYLTEVTRVRSNDAVEILRRAGVEYLDRKFLKRAVDVLGKSHDFAELLDDHFSTHDSLTVEDAIELFRISTGVVELDKENFIEAISRAGEEVNREDDYSQTDDHKNDTRVDEHHSKPEPIPEHIPYQYKRRIRHKKDEVDVPGEKTVTGETDTIRVDDKVEVLSQLDDNIVYRLEKTPSEVLVIHCGDPRFQTAFKQFVNGGLGIPNYTPIIIGGGLHVFGVQSFLPKNFQTIWQQIKFFVKERKLKQIIFINHEDCQWYKKMKDYRPSTPLLLQGKKDLVTAAERMVEEFSGVNVRSFFAAIKNDDQIVFEEVK